MEKFHRGNLLYFNPFIFPDGGTPKPKYFLVLANVGDDVLLASLPTSKDHVPADIPVKTYTSEAFAEQEETNQTTVCTIGTIRDDVFSRIIDCLKNSDAVRNRYKKLL